MKFLRSRKGKRRRYITGEKIFSKNFFILILREYTTRKESRLAIQEDRRNRRETYCGAHTHKRRSSDKILLIEYCACMLSTGKPHFEKEVQIRRLQQ